MKVSSFWVTFLGLYLLVVHHGAEAGPENQINRHRRPSLESEATEQPYRTAYHFQPPNNWMNDPNGPMYYKGVYHLFYQYNPYGPLWGNIVWAHSVSYDLVNWVHLDHALSPTDPEDINGCWSGSATLLPGEKPVILYTGADAKKRQSQNLAVPKNLSDPLLIEWVKSAHNPLMSPVDGIDPDQFRDPTTAWQGPDMTWRVLIGSQIDGHGNALLYPSKDFVNWTRSERPLHSSNRTGMWECPDFYPVTLNGKNGVDTTSFGEGTRHVLKASFDSHDYYIIGDYEPRRDNYLVQTNFMDEVSPLRYDYGKFYASKSFFDSAKKRRLLWGWINESDSESDDVKKGWSSLQSIPRTILLAENGRQLVQWPIEELKDLHEKEVNIHEKELKGGSVIEVEGVTASPFDFFFCNQVNLTRLLYNILQRLSNSCIVLLSKSPGQNDPVNSGKSQKADVEVSFHVPNLEEAEKIDTGSVDPQILCSQKGASVGGNAGPFGLLVLAAKDLKEQTAVFFRVFRRNNRFVVLMCSDQSRSSLREKIDKTTYGAFVDVDPVNKTLSLRSLIDHSVVESFGGGGLTCITARVYPKFAIDKKAHLYVFNNGTQSVTISKLSAWSMKQAQILPIQKRRKPILGTKP